MSIALLAIAACAGKPRNGTTLEFGASISAHVVTIIDDRTVQRQGAPTSTAPLEAPVALAVDRSGTMVIADRGSGRILKIDARGNLQAEVAFSVPRGLSPARPPRFVSIDMTGNVYVSDATNPWVSIYDSRLRLVSELEPPYEALGLPPGSISGLTSGSYGEFYMADQFNGRVYRFDASGRFMRDLNEEGTPWTHLNRPQGIACADLDGSVFVCESGNSQIVVYDDQGIQSRSFGGSDLREPVAVALDQRGRCFVADSSARAVLVFSVEGRFLSRIDGPYLGLQDLGSPTDLTVRDSTLYVADPSNGRILKVRLRTAEHSN